MPQRSQSVRFGLGLTLVCFCAPLFWGLRNLDLRNDEAIYAYAIDGMLESGDWLTPKSIPTDEPFFEKPPLKLWLIAALLRAGLLPHDEFGFRFSDAVMGAIAFVYVYLFGVRVGGGAVCGVVAVLMTASARALIFEHGLRENNMEAPLVLGYCLEPAVATTDRCAGIALRIASV